MQIPLTVDETEEEYAFLGMRFFPNKWQLQLSDSQNPISLTKVQREFLLLLVRHANSLVRYEDLRHAVWSHEPEVDQRLIHNMHVAKSKLTGLFDVRSLDSSFIESIDGEGYRLNAEVAYFPARRETAETESTIAEEGRLPATIKNTPTTVSTTFSDPSPQAAKQEINRTVMFSRDWPGDTPVGPDSRN